MKNRFAVVVTKLFEYLFFKILLLFIELGDVHWGGVHSSVMEVLLGMQNGLGAIPDISSLKKSGS